MCTIIGRKNEIEELRRYYESGRSELVAVYGRRRVGKTFLINEVFRDNMVFHHTGLSPYNKKKRVTMKDQLQNFWFSLIRHGAEGCSVPTSWMEAFFMLEQLLKLQDNGSRQIVFIDELPWMDTPRSGFLTAFESFWNGWANTRHNLCVVVCGSATSWMLDNFIEDKGGMYGRVTGKMKLSPFTLKECEEFYLSRSIKMSRYNIVQAYMVLGGIPYYMNYFDPSCSLAQNIDRLFFDRNAKLEDEFERLFRSVFDRAGDCMNIIRSVAKRRYGFTREEIAKMADIPLNGELTKMLRALSESNFLKRYVPFGYGKREEHYKLIDPFCWFWLHFKEDKHVTEHDYWQHHLQESEIASWRGISFEEVCMQHIYQIKHALGISGVSSTESAMIIRGDDNNKPEKQIDLIIDRRDDAINLCEMKYNKSKGHISSEYEEKLRSRAASLESLFPDKTILTTLVSNMPYEGGKDAIKCFVLTDDLFL